MENRPHIVVVEDEATQRQLLVDYLGRQNFRVSGVNGGTGLRKMIERERPALVLLDIGLPGEDGFALSRWLRETSPRIGIIMVTAASDTVDRVAGLETGADDYISKPFEPRELLARVKSVLRRATGAAVSAMGPRVRMGCRILDLEKRVLVNPSDGSEETLIASEFDLLKVFASAHSPSPRSTAQSSSNLQISGPSWRSAAFLRRLAASGQRFRWRLLEAASPFGVASVVAA
jgi:two-component system phosphate regulon response regulator OmpR